MSTSQNFCFKSHTEWLLLSAPRGSQLLNALISHTSLVKAQRVSRLFVKSINNPIPLLGDLLSGLAERRRHLDWRVEQVKFF